MGKDVIGILGSSKKDGKVALMLKEYLSAAEKAGHQVKQVNLYDKNIQYCHACMDCRINGTCSLTDDLNGLAAEIVKADVIVLAAPTYWANVPAVVKNLFDRMAGYVMSFPDKGIPKPKLSKDQRYVLITACSTPFPINIIRQSRGSLQAMNEFFKSSGMSKIASVVLPGTAGLTKIPSGILSRINKLGRSV
ncbi:MAG: flavodoxin family protein [Gorillibacterium sp.]|nr:flavodoxin family protein [Gorillibacterium sp.]